MYAQHKLRYADVGVFLSPISGLRESFHPKLSYRPIIQYLPVRFRGQMPISLLAKGLQRERETPASVAVTLDPLFATLDIFDQMFLDQEEGFHKMSEDVSLL